VALTSLAERVLLIVVDRNRMVVPSEVPRVNRDAAGRLGRHQLHAAQPGYSPVAALAVHGSSL